MYTKKECVGKDGWNAEKKRKNKKNCTEIKNKNIKKVTYTWRE